MDESELEQEIKEKGLNAPRLTPVWIDSKIASKHWFTAAQGVVGANTTAIAPASLATLTFCVIVLKNGYVVTGESACASPENFDAEIGKKRSFDIARNKIWGLEGYMLKQHLYDLAH